MINSTFSPSPENDSGKWDFQASNYDSMFLVTSPHLGTYQESESPHENQRLFLITQEVPRNLVALCEKLGAETKY